MGLRRAGAVSSVVANIFVPVALAGVVLLFAVAATASGSFTDPAADNGSAPDITTVTVTDDPSGNIIWDVSTLNYQATQTDLRWFIVLDTDRNSATGDPKSLGAEYYIERNGATGTYSVNRWDGSRWVYLSTPTAFSRYNLGIWTMRLNQSDIGGTYSFNFYVKTVQGPDANAKGHLDFAPDYGTYLDSVSPGATTSAAPGDLLVAGPGLQWLHADGTLVRRIVPDAAHIGAVSAQPGGGAAPTLAIQDPAIVRTYDQVGFELHSAVVNTTGGKATAVTQGASGQVYVAIDQGKSHTVKVYNKDPDGKLRGPKDLFPVPAQVTALAAAGDGCTVFYAMPSVAIGRLDVCLGVVLPDLLTGGSVGHIRLLPDRSILVIPADGAQIRRVRATGGTIQTYAVSGVSGWTAVDLAPDGASIWAATGAGALYRLDLATGAVVAGPITVSGPVDDLAVYGAPQGAAAPAPRAIGPQTIDLDHISTLDRESFSGQLHSSSTAPGLSCSPTASHFEFTDAVGKTLGPYRGGFVSGATVDVGAEVPDTRFGLLQLPAGRITKLAGTFALTQEKTKINGVYTGASAAENLANCTTFPNPAFPRYASSGYYWAFTSTTQYRAEIARNGRVYTDTGQASVTASRFYIVDQAGVVTGAGGTFDQSFVSSAIDVKDAFEKAGQSRKHSVGIPAGTTSITLTIRWESPKDVFSIGNIKLLPNRASALRLPSAGTVRDGPDAFRVTMTRGKRSLTVTLSHLNPGHVEFSVKAEKVNHDTRTHTAVRRSHRQRSVMTTAPTPPRRLDAMVGLPPVRGA